MLIKGQTTEQRIAGIADRFSQGLSGYAKSLNDTASLQREQNRYDEQRNLQEEALKRQEALKALEVSMTLTEKTGKLFTPEIVAPMLKSGDYSGFGETFKTLPATPKASQAEEDRALDREFKQSQINKNNRSGTGGAGGKGSVAEQSVDRGFAKTYDDFIVGGGFTKVDRGLKALKNVSEQLGAKGADLTGPITGRVPEFVQSFTNPRAIEARDEVGTIIQDNLRAILGPTYTEKEGERVIKRAYDPTLSEKANKAKLDALIGQMESAARAKLEAAKYYEQNGTMRGFKGTVINSVDDVFNQPVSTGQAAPVRVNQQHVQAIKQMSDEELLRFVQGG